MIRAEPCRCGSSDLVSQYNSSTGEKWIKCDSCGNTSAPFITNNHISIVESWNLENGGLIKDRG